MSGKESILKRITESVRSTAPGAILILYGSYARGDYNDESDIDLLVLLNKEKISYVEEKKIKYPLYHIEYDTGTIISPIVLSKQAWENKHNITPFYQNIIKEGIVL